MTDANAPALLAMALPALLFLYLAWRREWEWAGLYLALSFAISAWIKCDVLFSHLLTPSAPQRASLSWSIIGAVLYFGGLIGAMRGASTLRTLFIALAAMETLFVAIVPLYRFVFGLDQRVYFIINGQDVSNGLGATVILIFALLPTMIGIPWMLARQSASEKNIIAPALSRYGMLSGIGVVAFMVFSTCFVAWGYIGYGPFAGIPQSPAFPINQSLVGPNAIFGMLIGAVIFLFWIFPQRFFEPVVKLLEASQDINSGPLENMAHPLWRGVARNLDESRREAIESQKGRQKAERDIAESQANLKAFFDYAPLQVYVTDLDHKIVMVNDWVHRETGADVFRPENVIGLSADQMVPSSWAEQSHDNDATVVEKGGVTQVEVRGAFGGKERDIISIRFPIKDAEGNVIRIGGFVVDVSAQENARREAENSRAMLQAFFDHLPGLAFLSSSDGNIVAANSYMAEHFGFENMRSEDLVGKRGRDLLPKSWATSADKAVEANQSNGKAFAFEQVVKSPTGEHHVSTIRFPIRNEAGETTHVGGLMFDRTAEKHAADEVNAAREGLHQSEKLAALGQLLAGVAHELNNPLAIVMGRAAMLKEKLAGTAHEDSIQRLRDAADRCARIVKTFITMARQTGPQRTMVQIPDLIEAALDMTGHTLRSAGIVLEQQIAPDMPDLTADGDQLIQVLINLIINAQHAMEGQAEEPRLLIAARQAAGGKRVVVEISDNGPGVAAELAAKIFDPFFTTKDVGLGTGLGLSVCQSMIEAHGGTLELAKPAIGGATFRISLPLGEAQAAAEAIAEPAKSHRGTALIVDDEEEVADILAEILDGMGIACAVVTSGQAALEAIAARNFDAIFSDVRMPRMGGSELLAAIQADHPALVSRIIFATGDVLHPQVETLRATGRPIVEKPYDPQQLNAVLNEMLKTGETP